MLIILVCIIPCLHSATLWLLYIYITSTQQKWKGKAHSFNKKYCYKVNSLIRPYCHYSLPCDTYIYLLNWQGQFNNNGPKSTSTNCWHHVIVNSLCSGREVTKCKKKKNPDTLRYLFTYSLQCSLYVVSRSKVLASAYQHLSGWNIPNTHLTIVSEMMPPWTSYLIIRWLVEGGEQHCHDDAFGEV